MLEESPIKVQQKRRNKKARSSWNATPALIKVKETGRINKHFYMQKNIQDWCNFRGNRTVRAQSLTFLAPKGLELICRIFLYLEVCLHVFDNR